MYTKTLNWREKSNLSLIPAGQVCHDLQFLSKELNFEGPLTCENMKTTIDDHETIYRHRTRYMMEVIASLLGLF